MGARPMAVIRAELAKLVELIALQKQLPYISAYLLAKAKLEKYQQQAQNSNQSVIQKSMESLSNILSLAENDPSDKSIKNYNKSLMLKKELETELKLSRDQEYVKKISECSHIFYTGPEYQNHVLTACLCCGVSSDDISHKGLSSEFQNQFDQVYNDLFVEGEYLGYPLVSGEFRSLEEARSYYQKALASNKEQDPNQTVALMLQLIKYERR